MLFQSDESEEVFKGASLLLKVICDLVDKEVKLYGKEITLLDSEHQFASIIVPLEEPHLSNVIIRVNRLCQLGAEYETLELIEPESGCCVVSVLEGRNIINRH